MTKLSIYEEQTGKKALAMNKYFKNDYIAKISNDLVILGSETAFETDCILVAIGRAPILPKARMGDFGDYTLTPDEYGFTDNDLKQAITLQRRQAQRN